MSGGHWGYMQFKLEDRGREVGAMYQLLAVLEHELDWGICGDTCHQCARNRMGPALEAFFDSPDDPVRAIAVARDRQQHLCERCAPRVQSTHEEEER